MAREFQPKLGSARCHCISQAPLPGYHFYSSNIVRFVVNGRKNLRQGRSMKTIYQRPTFAMSLNSLSSWVTRAGLVLGLLVGVCLDAGLLLAQEDADSPVAICRGLVSRLEAPETRSATIKELAAQKDKLVGWAETEKDEFLVQYAAGTACIINDQPEKAIPFCRLAFELSGNHPTTATQYILALKMTHRPQEVVDVMKQTVESNPDVAQLRFLLGVHHTGVQEYQEALLLFKEFDKPIPDPIPDAARRDVATVRLQIAKVQLYLGKHDEAIEGLEQANTILPKAVGVLLPLGEAYLKVGETEKAKARLQTALSVNEKVPATLYWLGVAHEQEDSAKAKDYFEKAWEFGVPRFVGAENGSDLFLMHQVALKLNKQAEATKYKNDAEKLGFTFEAPWATFSSDLSSHRGG